VVIVSRAGMRYPRLELDICGFTAQHPLPVVQVPLLPPDQDIALDLGPVFARAYDTGPYRKILDYARPPDPDAVS
jgi:hypothetical protein